MSKPQYLKHLWDSDENPTHAYYKCLLCNEMAYRRKRDVTSCHVRSCGCLAHRNSVMRGNVFGRLTVLRLEDAPKGKRRRWLCQCSCGNLVRAYAHNLTSGKTTSCGHSRSALRDTLASIGK